MDECKVCANADNEYCFACDNGNQFKPTTNADRIRAMSDEELADWLYVWAGGSPNCDRDGVDTKTCRECWYTWLKQEAE